MANWDDLGTDGNVDDRRGAGPSFGLTSSLLTFGAVLILGFFGISADPQLVGQLIQLTGVDKSQTSQQSGEYAGNDSYEKFARSVLGSTDTFWGNQLQSVSLQSSYQKPKLVLFRGMTQSSCGVASSDSGPHYCPADQTIYLDETFFDLLKTQLGGSNADVAQAYVIAHEVGHHVQNEIGTMARVQSDPNFQATGENSLSVKLELQADCYAGLWAKSIQNQGFFNTDAQIREVLSAASAVGDDKIQQKTSGQVSPETWTHGSAAERMAAFKKGLANTSYKACAF